MGEASEDELKHSRTLVVIPIVHSQEDMGSSSDDVRQAYIQHKGPEAWEESRAAIKKLWTDIEAAVFALRIDFGRVRIFQDGLPVCGFEARIARDLAGTTAGGMNYQILARLMDLGATLEGTEDVELLLKERQFLKSGRALPNHATSTVSFEEDSDSMMRILLDERDSYIAKRIEDTLLPGEIGFLFLGALHDVTAKIHSTIKIVTLDEFALAN